MKTIVCLLALISPSLSHADGGTIGGAPISKVGMESSSPTLRGTWNFVNCITIAGQQVCAPSAPVVNAGTQPNVSTLTATGLNFASGGSTITSQGTLTISTAASSASATPNLFLSGNGNVGVGTGSPQVKLDVNGQVGAVGYATADGFGGLLPGISSACTGSQYFDAQRVDGGLVTGGTCNSAAPAVLNGTQTWSGQNTFAGVTVFSTSTIFTPGIGQPTSTAGQAILYYDANLGGLAITQNGGVGQAIPDPPGNWTCVIRVGAVIPTLTCATSHATSSAVCLTNEKALGGGCRNTDLGSAVTSTIISGPTGQGWDCTCDYMGIAGLQAAANCCK